MSTNEGLFLAIGWVLLRFGLPLLVTLLLIVLFSRLDSRWREDALSQKQAQVKDQILPTIKCWVFQDCPPEKRETCPAYQEKNIPCWQQFRDAYGVLQDGCLDCDVFRGATVPIPRQL